MIQRVMNYLLDLRDRQRIAIGLCKGAAMMHARRIDLRKPSSWEFSGFSQNGEDGILDVLRGQLLRSNRYFIEIGAADCIENNTAWLLIAEKYSGLMIEGSPELVERAKRTVIGYSIGAEIHRLFVTLPAVQKIKHIALHLDPDVLSLDIDGIDYYIAKEALESGFRPKIVVVEYNSVFGRERAATIAYREDFVFTSAHPSHLYYGVSIAGWRKLLGQHGYRFVTVDRNGVNAFFVAPEHFDGDFLSAIDGLDFAENQAQLKRFKCSSDEQFRLIADQDFVTF